MPVANDDLAALVYRFIADYGPVAASAVAAALGYEARRVSYVIARLLDARRLVVAGVSPDDEPLYAAATVR